VRWLVCSFALIASSSLSVAQSPATEVRDAYLDSLGLPPEQAYQTRYLSIYNEPVERRGAVVSLLHYWPNGLSRATKFYYPRRVTPTLYAVEIDQYGWDAETWEKLADVEPWFAVRVLVTTGSWSPSYYDCVGKSWRQSKPAAEKIYNAPAPWVDYDQIKVLAQRTNSSVPVVRFDWFMNQTGDQQKRRVGYKDWLGLKKLVDAEKLAGFSKEIAATRPIVAGVFVRSQVSLNPRQVFRLAAADGVWWETRDVEDPTQKHKNARENFLDDFRPDAKEVFFGLPNGLFGFLLLNAKDEIQDVAPNTIAGDKASTNTNTTVRNGVSCLRCHTGLKTLGHEVHRQTFTQADELGIGSPIRKAKLLIEEQYLGDLTEKWTVDQDRYTKSLKKACGLTPIQFQKLFAESWARYEDGAAGSADVARELGVSERVLLASIDRYTKAVKDGHGIDGKGADEVLFSLRIVVAAIRANKPVERFELEQSLPFLYPIVGNLK
jgi:hypothetical protein